MTNKEMCKSKNITEKESYKRFSKEICKSCKNNKRDYDITYKNWLEDIYYV